MLRALFFAAIVVPHLVSADPVDDVVASAQRHFDNLPDVERVAVIAGLCGADETVNDQAAYCTTQNVIYLAAPAGDPRAPYLVAHLYGHAVQVRHGIADVALRTIRANRDREAELRQDVTRMVECIAGVILAQAGQQVALDELFDDAPFSGSHWGRDPLHAGPKVNLSLAKRAMWLSRGQTAGDPAVCDTPSFPADLAAAAFRR